MAPSIYEEITEAAVRTLRALSEESAGQLSEDYQAVGDDAKPEDRRHLALLLTEMPLVDAEGSGNWHLTSVVRL